MENPQPLIALASLRLGGAPLDQVIGRWGHAADVPMGTRRSHPERCRRTAGSRALLRGMLHELFDVEAASSTFESEENGRPRLRSNSTLAPPQISISHSRDAVLVAATRLGPIGVDIEGWRDDRPLSEMAALAFGVKECDVARASSRAFYRTWSLREAMSKATGEGLAMAMDRRDHFADAPEYGCWLAEEGESTWFFASLDIVGNHSAAVAVRCIPKNLPVSYNGDLMAYWRPRDDDD